MQKFLERLSVIWQTFWIRLKTLFQRAFRGIKKFFKAVRRNFRKFKRHTLTKFTRWVDPRLEKYRVKQHDYHANQVAENNVKNKQTENEVKNTRAEIKSVAGMAGDLAIQAEAVHYTPKTKQDFLELVKRTPRTVLSGRERNLLANVMNFDEQRVGDIMLPKEAITYVHDDEILGPLMLDRLYRSGFSHFPVVDHTNEVIGIIHTAVLNSLEEKETHRAGEFMEHRACFLREDYTLRQALAAFYRTNSYFFIVVDKRGKTVGLLTYQMLMNYLFGKNINDDFNADSERMQVAERKME